MKKQMMYKIVSLVVFAFVFFFAFYDDVYAEDINWCKTKDGNKAEMDSLDVTGRYGLSLTKLGGNSYQIKMSPPTNVANRCKVKFTVESIDDNTGDSNVGSVLTCDKPLTININGVVEDDDFGLPAVKVILVSNDPVIKDENSSNSCYYTTARATFTQSYDSGHSIHGIDINPGDVSSPNISIGKIDCNKSYAVGSFEERFCYAKKQAEVSGNSHDFGNSRYSGDYVNFKCDYNINGGKVPLDPSAVKGDDYYVNKNYLYGKTTETVNTGNYVYHYSPGTATEGEAASCDVSCEESVEVEYGPPVASKAGMCFEYKVRVTSRVSCSVSKLPTPPSTSTNYCTPYPVCIGSNGKVWKQGGPNQQFEKCIKNCDGGKYTKKCSNKCYKQVYGSSSSSKVALRSFDEVVATKLYNGSLSDCESINGGGCYVRDGDTINWTGTGAGRWYAEQNNPKWTNGNYDVFENGFYRRLYTGGGYCHDECSWNGCSGDVYLNPGMAQKDYDANLEKYNNAVTACSAKATCTTTTAEFTITADYTKEGETAVTQINFPYDNQKDTITHTSTVVAETSGNANTTLLPNDPTAGQGLLGCYKKNDTAQNLYRSTWGFPGTWFNLKTGEISYTSKPASNSAWYEYEKKFCVPNNAKSVNAKWWNEYYAKVSESKGIKISYKDPEIAAECCQPGTICNPTIGSIPEVYNIHARTNKFGYMGWLIQMDCFYALNSHPYGTGTSDKCVPKPDEYIIRSVDLSNVFPATDGSDTTSAASTGRTPGYNWSSYADNQKNSNYISDPKKYLEYVQGEGYAIYDDSNLDYEFYLSPQTIRSMRKDGGSGKNYSNFNNSDFFVDANGVARYKSSKIRSLPGSNKIANGQAIKCNNMVNYASPNCHVD